VTGGGASEARARHPSRSPRAEATACSSGPHHGAGTLARQQVTRGFTKGASNVDGRPQPLYDRRTGAIDPAVVAQWQQYDIGQKLTRDWGVLGPKLAGKLHVYIGSKDDFSFDGAVGLLKQSLAALGSDAVVEIVPGKDHFAMFFDPSINARIAAEMTETLRRAGIIGGSGAP
jgi:hypothetical protein